MDPNRKHYVFSPKSIQSRELLAVRASKSNVRPYSTMKINPHFPVKNIQNQINSNENFCQSKMFCNFGSGIYNQINSQMIDRINTQLDNTMVGPISEKLNQKPNNKNGVNGISMFDINQMNTCVLNQLSSTLASEIGKDMVNQINTNIIEEVDSNPLGFMYTAFNYFKDFVMDSFRGTTTTNNDSEIEEECMKRAMEESLKSFNEKQKRDLKMGNESNTSKPEKVDSKLNKKSLSNSFYRNLLEELSQEKKTRMADKHVSESESFDEYYDALSDCSDTCTETLPQILDTDALVPLCADDVVIEENHVQTQKMVDDLQMNLENMKLDVMSESENEFHFDSDEYIPTEFDTCQEIVGSQNMDCSQDIDQINKIESVSIMPKLASTNISEHIDSFQICWLSNSMFQYHLLFSSPKTTATPQLWSQKHRRKRSQSSSKGSNWRNKIQTSLDDFDGGTYFADEICQEEEKENSNKLPLSSDYFIPLTSACVLDSIHFKFPETPHTDDSSSDSDDIVFYDSDCEDNTNDDDGTRGNQNLGELSDSDDDTCSTVSDSMSDDSIVVPKRRRRTVSEESDDSFIVFGGDHNNDGGYGDEWDTDEEDCGIEDNNDIRVCGDVVDFSCPSSKIVKKCSKKVQFKNSVDLCAIHSMVKWDYAYRAARKGPWEELARDRSRFQLRITRLQNLLAPILTPQHRSRIYAERFAKWPQQK